MMKEITGQKVEIKDKRHPWYGNRGEVVGNEYISTLGLTKIRIRLESGHECFADQYQLEIINN